MNISKILDQASKLKIAVFGDYIEDRHLRGTVDRVSPEAPVVIVANPSEVRTAGGAGNVFMNLCNLGVETHLFCNATDPYHASKILDHVNGYTWINQNSNAVKTRVMSGNYHLLRLDTEIPYDQIEWLPFNQFSWWPQFERSCGEFDCIVFSDYEKGVVSDSLINGVMELAAVYGIPVVVDAKRDFHRYKGVTVLKCNKKEAEQIERTEFIAKNNIKYLVVTYGEEGISVYDQHGDAEGVDGIHINIVDVCGAGDTVTAIIAMVIGLEDSNLINAIKLANIAAAEACSHPGVHAISKEQLIHRFNEVSNG